MLDKIKSLDIADVISKYISLKKKGSTYEACCPFHNEKSPSFKVFPATGTYKCFGCGVSGDLISFVMQYNHLEFKEAVKTLALDNGIDYEWQQMNEEKKKLAEEEHWMKDKLYRVYDHAAKLYQDNLKDEKINTAISLRTSQQMIDKFQIGFAREDWNCLHDQLISFDYREDFLEKTDLFRKSEKNNKTYDFFRNRIMFPIHGLNGKIIGFSGRRFSENKEEAKYLNSSDSLIYNKGKILFGLWLEMESISKHNECNLVEGNFDVLRLHEIGIENTVAACGTALTYDHVKLIKRFTKNVNLIYDGDKSGQKAILKNAEILLQNEMNVYVIALPEDQDPDSYFTSKEIYEESHKNKVDFFEYYTSKLYNQSNGDPVKVSDSIENIAKKLSLIANDIKRNKFIEHLSKKYKNFGIVKKELFKLVENLREADQTIEVQESFGVLELPEDVDSSMAEKKGFFASKNKYYFFTGDGNNRNYVKVSNFIIKPLFHIYSKSDDKRIIEITNEFGAKRIVDVQSKSMVAIDHFQQRIYAEGNYLWFGNKTHYLRILNDISEAFPLANELKTLGWQREGFYAFSNGIYNGAWQPVNEFGITVHKNDKFFSPSFSLIYKDVREDDDEFENDRFFIFKESPVNFTQWSDLMQKVYGDNGIIAIAFVIASIFRDTIYEKYKIFPHLFLFGEKQSGKSQLGWSLSNIFMVGLPPFNLNSGTQVGFFRRLARVRNGIAWYDEYTNDIDEKRFQSLKAAYDGTGHEKGKMTKDNRTEITKINSSVCISGQYLPTRDDNALFTRSIMLGFKKQTYSEEEMKNYDKMKKYEEEGLSSLITEILPFREKIDKKFGMCFTEIFDSIKQSLIESKNEFEERLVRNFTTILAPLKIIMDDSDIHFPFTFDVIKNMSIGMISDLSQQISSSESLANFFALIQYMYENKQIVAEDDFEIKTLQKITILEKGKPVLTEFKQPVRVLLIRFSKIHPLYLELHRRQFNKNGVDKVSLEHYIKHHKSWIGYTDKIRIGDHVTSAYALNYNELNIQLDSGMLSESTELFKKDENSNNPPF